MRIGSKKVTIMDVRHWTFAGSKDAFCLILVLIAYLLTNPYFNDMGFILQWTMISGLLVLGVMVLFEAKVAYYFIREFIFKPIQDEDKHRPLEIESATPPSTRKNMESKPLQGLLAGYTTDTGEPVYLSYARLPQHVSICGSTGTGKSVIGGFLMMQQMRNGGGLLFIDGKLSDKELDGIYKNACWAGREIDLMIVNPAEPEHSNTYNPILYGDPQEVSSRLMSLMPDTSGNAGADHFRSSAQQAVETIISAFQRIGLPYHFEDLATVLLQEQALFYIEDTLVNLDPTGKETIQYINLLDRYRQKDSFNMEEFKKTLGGLAGRLHQFATGTFGKVMNTYNPEVNIEECILQNKIVYVMLPTMGKNEQAVALAKLIVADCRTAISRCQKKPPEMLPNPPFMVFPDESGSYMDENWSRIFEQSRSAKIFMMPAYQTFANLQPNGDKALSEIVMGNTYFKFFFKQLSTESATQAADEIGKYYRTTTAIGTGSGTSINSAEIDTSPVKTAGDNSAVNITQREEEVHIVRPEHFKAIPIGDCLLVAGGTHLYHLRVPFIEATEEGKKEFSRVTLNRFQRDEVVGLNLEKIMRKYTLNAF
jgi:intracellular multiplication protein IcmO